MSKRKPILCLDFDGVIHSYASGWRGPRTIPDPPVPGALLAIANYAEHFTVAVHSSRSRYLGGRYAMKRWLIEHYLQPKVVACAQALEAEKARIQIMVVETGLDPVEDHVRDFVRRTIKWPLFKPPALVTVDDRGYRFDGEFPSVEEVRAFRPWNKR